MLLQDTSRLEYVLDFRDERLVMVGFREEVGVLLLVPADCAQQDPLRSIAANGASRRFGQNFGHVVRFKIEHDDVGTVPFGKRGGNLAAIRFVDITAETRKGRAKHFTRFTGAIDDQNAWSNGQDWLRSPLRAR
jgi:hypothetical protein